MTSTRPDMSSGPPADLLGDRYELGDPIGRGRSTVFRAEDVRLRRPVAVKQVRLFDGGPEDSSGIRRRAMREAHAAARLSDPHVVTVFDIIEERDSIWLVMELIEAPSLSKLVGDSGPLPPTRVARIGLDVLSALTAAHSVGVVHRDVKPANVMVLPGDRAKLADFGVAKLRDDTQVTAAGLVIGSPAYMAPEQARAERAGPPADLWALGATLYFGVEGLSPFPGNNAIAVATAVIYGLPRPAERAGPLAPLIAGLLAKEPSERPSAAEVRRALREVSQGGRRAPSAPAAAGPSDTIVAPAGALPTPPAEPLPPGAPKHSGGAWRRRLVAERRGGRSGTPPAAPAPGEPTAPASPAPVSAAAAGAGAAAGPGIAEWLAAANEGRSAPEPAAPAADADEAASPTAGAGSAAEATTPAAARAASGGEAGSPTTGATPGRDASPPALAGAGSTIGDAPPPAAAASASGDATPPAAATAAAATAAAAAAGATAGAADNGLGSSAGATADAAGDAPAPPAEPPTIVIEDDDRPALGVASAPFAVPGDPPTVVSDDDRAGPAPGDRREGFSLPANWRPMPKSRDDLTTDEVKAVLGHPSPARPSGGPDGPEPPAEPPGAPGAILIEDDDRPALGVASPPAGSWRAAPPIARPAGGGKDDDGAGRKRAAAAAGAGVAATAAASRAGGGPAPGPDGAPPPLIRTIDGSGSGLGAAMRRTVPVALVVVAVMLAVALAVRAASGGDEEGAGNDTPATSAPATTAPVETRAPEATTTTAPATTTTAGPQVPAGWAEYRDPGGAFTIAHPPGWTVSQSGSQTRFREPGTGTYLLVEWTAQPRPDPVADWQAQSAGFQARHEGYRTVRIEAASYRDYNAAVWEFGYRDGGADLHVANLGFVTGGRGYALFFQTHEENWAASQPLFRQFQQAFRPAGGG